MPSVLTTNKPTFASQASSRPSGEGVTLPPENGNRTGEPPGDSEN